MAATESLPPTLHLPSSAVALALLQLPLSATCAGADMSLLSLSLPLSFSQIISLTCVCGCIKDAWLLGATVTNYQKLVLLKQCKLIISQFWRLESEIKVLAGP